MFRSEIMIDLKQKEILDTIAFILSKKTKKKISRSSLIRESINYWLKNIGEKELAKTDIKDYVGDYLIDAIIEAKEDLKNGRIYTYEEMLKEVD